MDHARDLVQNYCAGGRTLSEGGSPYATILAVLHHHFPGDELLAYGIDACHTHAQRSQYSSPMKAAGVVSTIGGVSMLGRLLTGFLIDRIGTRKSMATCFVLLIAAFLWLQVAREAWMLYLFAAVYGVAHGSFFTLISPTVARLFGISSHGVLLGIVLFSGNFGGAVGPVVAGYIFDLTSSYHVVFLLLAAALWCCSAAHSIVETGRSKNVRLGPRPEPARFLLTPSRLGSR